MISIASCIDETMKFGLAEPIELWDCGLSINPIAKILSTLAWFSQIGSVPMKKVALLAVDSSRQALLSEEPASRHPPLTKLKNTPRLGLFSFP